MKSIEFYRTYNDLRCQLSSIAEEKDPPIIEKIEVERKYNEPFADYLGTLIDIKV